MSRRRSDKAQRNPSMGHGQQAIWDEITRLKEFTITELWGVIDGHRTSIQQYVKRLVAGGYVEKFEDFDTSYCYRLVNDCGTHAPRLTKEGKPVTQGRGNLNMWNAMRALDRFTPLDLALHATTDTVTVNERTAQAYCTELRKAGYLRVLKKAQATKSQAIYRLIRDTGPKSPEIQSVKLVWDPNISEFASLEFASERRRK